MVLINMQHACTCDLVEPSAISAARVQIIPEIAQVGMLLKNSHIPTVLVSLVYQDSHQTCSVRVLLSTVFVGITLCCA